VELPGQPEDPGALEQAAQVALLVTMDQIQEDGVMALLEPDHFYQITLQLLL
jgi:hypothetical protein